MLLSIKELNGGWWPALLDRGWLTCQQCHIKAVGLFESLRSISFCILFLLIPLLFPCAMSKVSGIGLLPNIVIRHLL